jgi:hypothetical protein
VISTESNIKTTMIATLLIIFLIRFHAASANQFDYNTDNSIEQDQTIEAKHRHVACGTIASNHTHLIIKNPHYPKPTYVKAICETVIERSSEVTVDRLDIRFKQLELYRPNYDGTCLHDRFAVYTDLNVAVSPILCGNQTGQTISIPFLPPLTSLIISITTSDLDHDRAWLLEIEQGNQTSGYLSR